MIWRLLLTEVSDEGFCSSVRPFVSLYMNEFLLIYCRVPENTVWGIYIYFVPYYLILNYVFLSPYA